MQHMICCRTYHSSDVTIALEVFNNLLFVGWFDTGEAL